MTVLEELYKNTKVGKDLSFEEFVHKTQQPCEICGQLPREVNYGSGKVLRNWLAQNHRDTKNEVHTVCTFCSQLIFSWTPREILEKCQQIVANLSKETAHED